MTLTNDSIARMFKVLDIFNLMLSKLNISIEDYKKRKKTNDRTHDWSVPLDRLHKGELIEGFVLDYKNSNTKDEIYKYMIEKLNIAYKVFRS